MIQNLFVMKDGIALINQNFGECHSLTKDINLITSYLSALQIISEEITGTSIKNINFDEISFHFYIDKKKLGLSYIIVADNDDNLREINNKIHKIKNLFNQLYSAEIEQFNGNISQFKDFGTFLIENNILQINCGKKIDCNSCPNKINDSKMIETFRKNEDTFLVHIREN